MQYTVGMRVSFDIRHVESERVVKGAGLVTRVDRHGNPMVAPYVNIGRGCVIENITPVQEDGK